jgi:hypothetical protein
MDAQNGYKRAAKRRKKHKKKRGAGSVVGCRLILKVSLPSGDLLA